MKKLILILMLMCCATLMLNAQTEILTNAIVIEMSKVGLEKEIILKKISDSSVNFDVSVSGLIELKKAGVADEIIALMVEKSETKTPTDAKKDALQGFSETEPLTEAQKFTPTVVGAKDALLRAKTVAIEKSSLNPSRQALEKALLKRKEWQKYNLTLVRYKNEADIFIEIGRIPFSWITHRYVFRIYDRRSGTIITAGETTSWGSLAENMAREITQKMNAAAGK